MNPLRLLIPILWLPIGVVVAGFFKGVTEDDLVDGEVYLFTIIFWPMVVALMVGVWLFNRARSWGQGVAGR